MNGSAFVTAITLLLCFMRFFKPIQGGICWLSMSKNGRCMEVLAMNSTKEDCCQQNTDASSAWSEEDLDSGRFFFLRVLGGGVPCHSCRENKDANKWGNYVYNCETENVNLSCAGVECNPDKKCVIRNGRPKCVCAPCKGKGRRQGPVCGTDGNSYANVCRLKKQACRKKISNLSVAYSGYCQSTCEKLNCPEGKFCVVDQNLTPHCVECPVCPPDPNRDPENRFCGSDGKTYDNICQLRYTACTTGKGIPIAYKGKCKEKASCSNIDCGRGQLCLTEPVTGQPRCVTCDMDCPATLAGQRREFGGPICGTNNKTYDNWCQMKKDACETRTVIETRSPGVCKRGKKERSTFAKKSRYSQ